MHVLTKVDRDTTSNTDSDLHTADTHKNGQQYPIVPECQLQSNCWVKAITGADEWKKLTFYAAIKSHNDGVLPQDMH